MARTIAMKTRRSLQGYLSETEDEEGYQQKVPDREINLSDDSEDENKGRETSGVTSADVGA